MDKISMLEKLRKAAKDKNCKIVFSDNHFRIKYQKRYSDRCITFWDGYKNIHILTT